MMNLSCFTLRLLKCLKVFGSRCGLIAAGRVSAVDVESRFENHIAGAMPAVGR